MYFNISTYGNDLDLFKELELKPFNGIPERKEYFVGDIQLDKQTLIEIYVIGYPALFWKAQIYKGKERKYFKSINTGSGSLSDYWCVIKIIAQDRMTREVFELLGENMITIKDFS